MYNKTILVFGHAYGLQALKEVLKKDFDGEEEMQAETLLYKNLWLEAEAALCSVSYRARFNRMKIEMEKCKTHKAKGLKCPPNHRFLPSLLVIIFLAFGFY